MKSSTVRAILIYWSSIKYAYAIFWLLSNSFVRHKVWLPSSVLTFSDMFPEDYSAGFRDIGDHAEWCGRCFDKWITARGLSLSVLESDF